MFDSHLQSTSPSSSNRSNKNHPPLRRDSPLNHSCHLNSQPREINPSRIHSENNFGIQSNNSFYQNHCGRNNRENSPPPPRCHDNNNLRMPNNHSKSPPRRDIHQLFSFLNPKPRPPVQSANNPNNTFDFYRVQDNSYSCPSSNYRNTDNSNTENNSFSYRSNSFEKEDIKKIRVNISGGHETDPRDHGRPVVLIAAGLGISPDIFRHAFSQVSPAPNGRLPDNARIHSNKQILLRSLSKYGISNELLDNVSDYYRYNPGSSGLWPTKPAIVEVIIDNNKIIFFDIIEGGSGYCSIPKLYIPGHGNINVDINLSFSKNLRSNGSISSITIVT